RPILLLRQTGDRMKWLIVLCITFCVGCATHLQKPPTVTREQWGSQPQPIPDSRRHTPQFITIHHAGVPWKPGRDPADFVRNMQTWGQREKHWPDLPYHFMIAPDGRIFEARPIQYEPESNT